jgi:hypothetical protein
MTIALEKALACDSPPVFQGLKVLVERHKEVRVMKSLMVLAFSLMTTGLMAEAMPVIDFGIVFPTAGSLNFDDGFVGTGIQIDNVGAIIGDNIIAPVAVTSGVLNFNSNTGEITITGAIPAAEIGETVLMTGQITSAKLTGDVLVITFKDNKDDDLIDFFQMPRQLDNAGGGEVDFAYHGTLNLQFHPDNLTPLSGDLTNYPVPEPVTLLLVGAGLVGLGLIRRKRTA